MNEGGQGELHDAIKLEQLNQMIVYVSTNFIEIV